MIRDGADAANAREIAMLKAQVAARDELLREAIGLLTRACRRMGQEQGDLDVRVAVRDWAKRGGLLP